MTTSIYFRCYTYSKMRSMMIFKTECFLLVFSCHTIFLPGHPFFCAIRENISFKQEASRRPFISSLGPYAFLRKGPRDQSHTADLTSPPLCVAASVTVSFTYVITHPSCELRVLTQCQGHEAGSDTIKYITSYAKTWQRKNVTLPACPHSDVTVRN